jgi:AAA15 family ATPase/GTPase
MLDSLHIRNFRCFEDLQVPSLGRINLIVGKNNTGKSTLLEAVYVFAKNGAQEALKEILDNRHEFFSELPSSQGQGNNSMEVFWQRLSSSKLKNDEVTIKNIDGTSVVSSNLSIINGFLLDYTDHFPLNERGSATLPHAIISTNIESETKLATLWDEVYLNSEDQFLQEALHIINPNITSLMFVQRPDKLADNSNQGQRVAVVKLKGEAKAVPLKAMGEGMSRLLQIFLHAFFARNGYLMIDEFENGLHYSIQEEVLEKLFKLAKELDIQVFLTTHSKDTIKAFSKVALRSPEEGRLISLGRNERDIDKGKITALVYDESDIQLIAETDMEVR